jgi:galactokinase
VQSHFIERFNSPPSAIVRSPGRVNLIGEHVDYMGYSVLPMAIEMDCMIAVSTRPVQIGTSATLDVHHVHEDSTGNGEMMEGLNGVVLDKQLIDIDAQMHKWTNYVLAGVKVGDRDFAII